jgi:hypothetical protein
MKKSETVIRLERECVSLSEECARLREALGAVMAGEAILVGQFTLDRQTVKARLIGHDRAHGGLLLVSDSMAGERPMHRVHYLEQYQADFARSLGTDYAREMYCLIGKAVTKAYQLRQTAGHDAHIQSGRYEAGCQECLRVAREVSEREDREESTRVTLKALETLKD